MKKLMKNIISDSLKIGGVIVEDKKSLLKKEISQLPNGMQLAIGATKNGCSLDNRYFPFSRINK
jgi:hypothetical protein